MLTRHAPFFFVWVRPNGGGARIRRRLALEESANDESDERIWNRILDL
jgi:hypothetical protein